MTFVVEDGTGVANANSYITTAFADSYFADRGVVAWTGSDTLKQQAIIRAVDYIDTLFGRRYRGRPVFRCPPLVQSLGWPRECTGDYLVDFVMPLSLQKAVAEYALRALTANLIVDPTPGIGLTSEKSVTVGPLKVDTKYTSVGGVPGFASYPAADMLLRPLLTGIGGTVR